MRSALETTTTTMSPLVSLHPSTSSERVPRPTKEGKMCAQLRREEEFFCHSPPSHKMPFPQCCPRRRQGEEGNEYTKLAAGYPSSTFLWGKPRAMQNALYGDTQNVVALQGITLKRESSHAGLNPRLGKFMCYALPKYAVFHLKGPVNRNGPKHDFILGNYGNRKQHYAVFSCAAEKTQEERLAFPSLSLAFFLVYRIFFLSSFLSPKKFHA